MPIIKHSSVKYKIYVSFAIFRRHDPAPILFAPLIRQRADTA
ncbi:hypothetical protein [Moraxella lacunata]